MNKKIFIRLSIVMLVVLVLQISFSVSPQYSVVSAQTPVSSRGLYEHKVIARTDLMDISELSAPSINNDGTIVFVGKAGSGTENIFVRDEDSGTPYSITTFEQANRFVRVTQINDRKQVVAQDGLLEPAIRSNLRIWDANNINDDRIVSRSPENFDLFIGNSSINNKGDVVFTVLHGSDYLLVTPSPNGFITQTVGTIHSSMIADDGRIVIWTDQLPWFPIQSFPQIRIFTTGSNLLSSRAIASEVMGFTELGRSPGISDNGRAIAFYAELSIDGATALETTPGPGIFVAIEIDNEWILKRIAGIAGNGYLDPGEIHDDRNGNGLVEEGEDEGSITDFLMHSHVGANFRDDIPSMVNVAFVARDTSYEPSIYVNSLNLDADSNQFQAGQPSLVIKAGDRLPDGVGTVSSVEIYDPINTLGQVTFWVETNAGIQSVVRSSPTLRPVLIVPGIAGTFPLESEFESWLMERGVAPDRLEIDPLKRVYHDLIQTFENAGYERDKTLFVANYDWRMPPGPVDGLINGHIDGISSSSITDDDYEYGVDYLGYWLARAAESWSVDHSSLPLDGVDIVAHSTGGLVVRCYIQSDAYGNTFNGSNGEVLHLPTINNLIMIGVPNRGASKAWNPLHDNWISDDAYRLLLSKLLVKPYKNVVMSDGQISGPGAPITMGSISDNQGQPDPVKFINQYLPSTRSLLATYAFFDFGNGISDINSGPHYVHERNNLILDLNAGLDLLDNPGDHNEFADQVGRTTVIYSDSEETATTVTQQLGPLFHSPESIVSDQVVKFTDFRPRTPAHLETWYTDVTENEGGDGTVPTISAKGQFLGDDRVELILCRKGRGKCTHLGLMSNPKVQEDILERLGFRSEDISDIEISTGLSNDEWSRIFGAAGMSLDPVDAFLVDANGFRLGYSQATGAVSEIPRSVWYGESEGIGWIIGPFVTPLELHLTGLGQNYRVQVFAQRGLEVEGFAFSGLLAEGEHRRHVIPFSFIDDDNIEPTVHIDSPAQGTSIPRGSDLKVGLVATDNVEVDSVTATFDVNGDGTIDVANETIPATRTGTDTYEAIFANILGPEGPRTISVFAEDTSGNVGTANTTIIVSDSAGNGTAPTVSIDTPVSGVLQSLHSNLTATLIVTSEVDVTSVTVLFDTDGNGLINRFGEFVRANKVNGNTYTATFNNVSGPVGARLLRAFAADAELKIGAAVATVMVGDTTQPTLSVDWPTPGMLVPIGGDLTVSFKASDDVAVESVTLLFDTNGDDTIAGPSEIITRTSISPDTYEVNLVNISGDSGRRTIRISAEDPSLNVSVANRVVTVGDTVPIVGAGTSAPYEMIYGLGRITSVAYAPNGDKALIGGQNGFVVLLDLRDLNAVSIEKHFFGHTGEITAVGIFPDMNGQLRAITGSQDGTVRLWDMADGKLLRVFSHPSSIADAALSPNGERLVASSGTTAWLWDVSSGRLICSFKEHTGKVKAIAFNPDGSQVLSGSDSPSDSIRRWEAGNCSQIDEYTNGGAEVTDLAFSPNSEWILAGTKARTAYLLHVDDHTLETLPHNDVVYSVAFHPNGKYVAIGSRSSVNLFDVEPRQQVHDAVCTFEGHGNQVNAIAFSPAEHSFNILTGSADRTMRLWDATVESCSTATGSQELFTFRAGHSGITSMVLSEDGRYLLTGGDGRDGDGTVRIWRVPSGDLEQVIWMPIHSGTHVASYIAAWFAEGQQILTGDSSSRVRIWDVATATISRTIDVPDLNYIAVALTSDDKLIATGGIDGLVRRWDVATGREQLPPLAAHRERVNAVAYSPVVTQLLSAGNDNMALLWDLSSEDAPISTALNHNGPVLALAFSSDGSHILTGSADGTAKLWDATDLIPAKQTFGGLGQVSVTSVAFSSNNRQVLTGHGDGRVRLWDVETGKLLRTYEDGDSSGGRLAAFSSDDNSILMSSTNGMVWLKKVAASAIPPRSLPNDTLHDGRLVATAWSPSNNELVTLGCRAARLWNADGTLLRSLFENRNNTNCLFGQIEFSPRGAYDGSYILTWVNTGSLEVWDAESDQSFPLSQPQAIKAAATSNDGFWLARGVVNEELQMLTWNAEETRWELYTTLKGYSNNINAMAFSPDGKQVLIGTEDDFHVRQWDLDSGKVITLTSHTNAVTSVAYSSDGTRALTGSRDKTVRLWDLATGTLLHVYSHPHAVESATFVPNKPWIVSTGENSHTAYVWDIEQGELVFAVSHLDNISTAVLSPDGMQLLTGGSDGTVQFWDIDE